MELNEYRFHAALGDAYRTHAADLAAAAAALRSIPSPAAELGTVGDRFVAAFIDALAFQSRTAAALSESAHAAGATAGGSAAAFDAAGQRAAHLLPRV